MSGPFDTADYTPGYRTQIAQLEAEVQRLREGGRETNAKLDHTLQAYGRLERANADLRRENERLVSLDAVVQAMRDSCLNGMARAADWVEAEFGSPERPTP